MKFCYNKILMEGSWSILEPQILPTDYSAAWLFQKLLYTGIGPLQITYSAYGLLYFYVASKYFGEGR